METPGAIVSLAGIYLGAKITRTSADNPDFLSQSAHSIRELLDALPERYPEVPVFDHQDLVSRARQIIKDWSRYDKATVEGKETELKRFTSKMQKFCEEMDGVTVTRRAQASALLGALDPTRRLLPAPIAKLRVDEWGVYRNYFVEACHHRRGDLEEFDGMLAAFESFLVGALGLRTLGNRAAIQAIIEEGEQRA